MLVYTAPSGMQKFATSLRLIRALPWRRFKKGSVLVIEVTGKHHTFVECLLRCSSQICVSPAQTVNHLTDFVLRLKRCSVCLCMQLGGGITEKRQGRFGDAKSMPQITAALKKAAYDPRISGIVLKVSPLSAGWAKLQEIRQYIEFFR